MCLSVTFETFFRTLILQSTSGKLLFYVQAAQFQLPDSVKNYFTGAFQALYIRSRSGHLKAFIYLKYLETLSEEVNLLWSCEMPICTFTKKKLPFPSCSLPSFSQNTSRLPLPKRLWKRESTISFWKCKRKVVPLVIYLFNYDSSKSAFFMLNIAFDVLLSAVFINKLEFFISWNNIKITSTSFICSVFSYVLFYKKSNCSPSWWQ